MRSRYNDIHIPIALRKITSELVDALSVDNGKACNCFCANCGEDLIAVNRVVKQRAHFRHERSTDCLFNNNFESYIHWLAKEVFKTLPYIVLPPIHLSHLDIKLVEQKIQSISQEIGLNEPLRITDFSWDTIVFQKPKQLVFDKCSIEKTYNSPNGSVRIDIVVIKNHELFIEPFFTNKVSEQKNRIIRDLNVSTIAINLLNFAKANQSFTLKQFKKELSHNFYNKQWIYLNREKGEKLVAELFNASFKDCLIKLQNNIDLNKKTQSQISKLNHQIALAHKDIEELKTKYVHIDYNELFKIGDKRA